MKLFEEFIVEKYGGLFTFNELIEAGLPDLYLKIEKVQKKLKELETKRRGKFAGEYARRINEQMDLEVKKNLLKPVVEITKKIKFLENTLNRLIELEDGYITKLVNEKQVDDSTSKYVMETGKFEADISIIENRANELLLLLQEQNNSFDNLPKWVILKIENAKNYLSSVTSYLNKSYEI